jgi:hypothetical protein
MRWTNCLALAAILIAVPGRSAQAQGTGFFTQPFTFTDARGTGTLTVYPLTSASTRLSYQPVQVTLVQGNSTMSGSGVYHSFQDDGVGLPPTALLSFSLLDLGGNSRFYQGTLTATTINTSGSGTSWPTLSPQSATSWSCQTASGGTTPPPSGSQVVNSSPSLVQGWNQVNFNEAIGGRYYSTYNTYSTPVSTATWSGSLPSGQRNYLIEVFIPRQGSPSSVPRTTNAIYQIGSASTGTGPTALSYRTSQNVSVSQWIPIGSAVFNGNYRITLTDATGEQTSSRSVVANAVRLTPNP